LRRDARSFDTAKSNRCRYFLFQALDLAPLVHAASRRIRREIYEMYARFVAAFREAAEHLRAEDRSVKFPEGSFPPGLPFVRAGLAPAA
jgi:hypothetical protein